MTIETIDKKIILSGEVSVLDVINFPIWEENGDYHYIVDLSQAVFLEEEEQHRRSMGMGHSGPVYVGETTVIKISALQKLLERLLTGTVILPACVTRKQLNTCIKNRFIGKIIVPDDCRLFSMKDGSIWNKKGTILIHEQHGDPEFVTCEECGCSVLASVCGKTIDGGLVCPDCIMRLTTFSGYCGTYVLHKGLYYKESDPRLIALFAQEGKTMDDYREELYEQYRKG